MNKKFVASLAALLMASSFFTVSAAPKSINKKTAVGKIAQAKTKAQKTAEMKALEDQVKANSQAEKDLVKKVLESTEYKQLQLKQFELQKSIIDQQLKEGNISVNQATAKKAQIDAAEKVFQDTALQTLQTELKTIQSQIKDLKIKYPKLADLIATQDFKDLKIKLVTNIKAIVDRYVADGAMTSDEATTAKTNIDKISANIDAGKTDVNALLNVFNKNSKVKNFRGKNAKKNAPAVKNSNSTTQPASSGNSL